MIYLGFDKKNYTFKDAKLFTVSGISFRALEPTGKDGNDGNL